MRLGLFISAALLATAAHAGTFYNPTGAQAIEEKGALAAAELNEALSSIHLMYAALERKDTAAFQKHRNSAMKLLASSAGKFRDIEKQMPTREFKATPKTPAETETIDTFLKYTVPRYKPALSQVKTEQDLVHVAVVIVDSIGARLAKDDIKPGSQDWRPVREVIRMQLDLTGAGLAASLIFSSQK